LSNDDIFRIRGQKPAPIPRSRLLQARGHTSQSPQILRVRLRLITEKTIESAFNDFISDQISIPPGARKQASTSQTHLRDFLASEIDRDEFFPRVLQIADTDFLGGSFARHTKIWPLDDIDVYIPLDGLGLYYLWYGVPQNYTVVSDNVLEENPLLLASERWMDGTHISSVKIIREFKTVLRNHYTKTPVKDEDQAINIQMTYGETKEEDGLGFDVVPCFRLKPHNTQEYPFYLIPDGKNGWIHTNPRLDTQLNEELNAKSNGLLRKAVKLVKFWNKNRFDSILGSYYIERRG